MSELLAKSDENSMHGGFIVATEVHDQKLSEGRWSGGGRSLLACRRLLLGILVIAQRFGTASAAESVLCHAFDGVGKKLDLIGLISAWRTEAATKSLSYSALNDIGFYVTGHVGPGSLSVAAALFQAAGSRLAQLAAFSGMGSALQLDRPDGLRYIGLKSNSECPVGNKVGASIVREYQSLWKVKGRKESSCLTAAAAEKLMQPILGVQSTEVNIEQTIFRECKGRDAKREVKVIVLEMGSETNKEVPVLLKSGKVDAFCLGWLPLLLTVGVMASSCISCNQLFVAGLIALGTLGMMVAVLGLRLCVFKYSKPQVAVGAPPGDCLVMDDTDVDTLHIILGEESVIQTVFQRKIECHQSLVCKYLLFTAGSLLGIYVVASVFYLPNVSLSGQVLFAIANLIGCVTDIVKASKNGNLGLAKKACEEFQIEARDLVMFRNRTAAVAYVAKHAKDCAVLRSKKLLPCDGPVWQKWWQELAKRVPKGDNTGNVESVGAADKEPMEKQDMELLEILLQDMRDGLAAKA